jgi:epoxyqueuosine reductase
MGLKQFIRGKAREQGFRAAGFSRAGRVPEEPLRKWLKNGFHGEMSYMERSPERRLDPGLVLEGARTVVSLLYPYPHKVAVAAENRNLGIVARYALGKDYHLVLEKKLKRLLAGIREAYPQVRGRCYVDSGPVSETYWAWKGGLGWIGRNSLLISREFGSWFFLSDILLNAEIEPDAEGIDFCGTCTACVDACPTGAIVESGTVDARKCISYLTIEHRSEIPSALGEKMGNRIFGCDICQEVCPWNRKVPEVEDLLFEPVPRDYSLDSLSRLNEEEFREVFKQSPVKRTGLEGLKRNISTARKNQDLTISSE